MENNMDINDLHKLQTAEELLQWMLEIAEARDCDPNRRVRTINLKFSRATLRMWMDRARPAVRRQVKMRDTCIWVGAKLNDLMDQHEPRTEQWKALQALMFTLYEAVQKTPQDDAALPEKAALSADSLLRIKYNENTDALVKKDDGNLYVLIRKITEPGVVILTSQP
jgi:hypothetical protein